MPKKKEKTMKEVSKGFENFIAGKESTKETKKLFEKTLKKSVQSPKLRGSK